MRGDLNRLSHRSCDQIRNIGVLPALTRTSLLRALEFSRSYGLSCTLISESVI